jgi:hypothetical protein
VLVLFWTMLALWPARAYRRRGERLICIASALLTPGIVIVVGLMLLNAHLVGVRLFAGCGRGAT